MCYKDLSEFTKNRYKDLKSFDESFEVKYHAFKVIYQYLDYSQKRLLEELVKKSEKAECNLLIFIEAHNAIDPDIDHPLIVEMVEFERQRILDALPEKIKSDAKYNLILKLRNS